MPCEAGQGPDVILAKPTRLAARQERALCQATRLFRIADLDKSQNAEVAVPTLKLIWQKGVAAIEQLRRVALRQNAEIDAGGREIVQRRIGPSIVIPPVAADAAYDGCSASGLRNKGLSVTDCSELSAISSACAVTRRNWPITRGRIR